MTLEWTVKNIKGDHSTLLMNKILIEENSKTNAQP